VNSNDDSGSILRPRDTITVENAGVDEVSVVPWTMMLPRKIARRVGITRQWATLSVVLGGLFATSFTITVLVVSLEGIATDLDTSVSALNWAIIGPMLAFGVVGPAYGKAGDLWGHKRVFVLGLLFAGFFGILTAVAWNAASMITFRILSASAGSATGPAAMAYINRLFEPQDRVMPLSLWSFTTAGAPVLGVVLGAPLVESIGWRTIFIVQAPLCIVGAAVAFWLLPQTSRMKNVKFDVWGSLTLGGGATAVLFGINRGHAWGWTSPRIVISIALGLILLRQFVRIERRVEEPLMPLSWLRTPNIAFPIMSQSLTNFAYMGGFIIVPQLLDKGLGMTSSHIGWLVIARPLTFSIVAPLGSFVTMRVGERVSSMVGAGFVMASMVSLSLVGLGTRDVFIAGALALSGVGLGLASPALTALVANAVDDDHLGVAGAMQQLMNQMGAVVGSTVMISIHESTMSHGEIESFGYALLAGAVCAGVGMLIASKVTSTDRSEFRKVA
jgi:MFS family permease